MLFKPVRFKLGKASIFEGNDGFEKSKPDRFHYQYKLGERQIII
jgi:hypothetical protein